MNTFPWHVGVLIPARNEEDLLPRCLRSVLTARDRLEKAADVYIVVVADSSTDRTAQIAADMLRGEGAVYNITAGVVGNARRIATKLFLENYHGPLRRCWLANTDADCVVPPNWLSTQLEFAKMGIEAVAGTVSVDTFEEHGPEVSDRFKSTYLIGPDGSHPHVHGANLGICADTYLLAGGWQNLATSEDHDLWRRLSLVGARTLSTCQLEVQTSGRRVGRAPNGFAEALARHNETAA